MRLHSSSFEKALRKEIKREVRADPELRRESRRSNKRLRIPWLGYALRPVISWLLATLIWKTVQTTHHVDAGLMVMNLWILTLTCGFASNLLQLPFRSSDIAALRLLPAAESVIFRWELTKFLIASAFCLSDLIVGFSALAWILHLSFLQWGVALLLAPLTGAFMIALAALGATRLPWLPYAFIQGCLYFFGVSVIFTTKFSIPHLLPVIDHSAPVFNLLVPTGWPLSLFHLVLLDGHGLLALVALPIGGVLWSFRSSCERILERFVYIEPLISEVADLVPGEEIAESTTTNDGSEPVRRLIGPTAIGEGILSGRFLLQEEWDRGWLERKLWQWLSRREKTLAEFTFPNGLAITTSWQRILRNFLIATLLGYGVNLANPTLGLWTLSAGLVLVSFQASIQILATGAAFGAIRIGGLHIPIYAAYPITFRDLSRTLLKCSAIQMPFFILLIAASLILLSHFTQLTFVMDLLIAINAGVVFWGARFFLLVFNFSSGTNDSSTFSLRSLGLFVLFALFGLSFLILAVFTGMSVIVGVGSEVVWTIQPIMWIGCLLALLDGYIFFRIYGWLYSANRFDLIRTTP